jgi:hypothetical protein
MTDARRLFWIAGAVCLGATVLYLAAARGLAGTFAFPLDDAWIHQSYARTVAEHGEWAFLPGSPSSGSTAPLWTLLLVPGHWLQSPVAWSYALGFAGWGAMVALGYTLSLTLWKDRTIAGWSALALAVEWHLAWAAVSGMEIVLYTALVLLLLTLYLTRRGNPFVWGVVGGALTLTRPEGMLLLALVGAHFVWERRRAWRGVVQGLVALGAGWLLFVAPYGIFNWAVSGLVFPNTFYAKQQEYGILLETVPLYERLLSLAWQPWIGGQALLLLGLPWFPWRRLSSAQWLPLLWATSIVVLYAARLPVTYQHARYLMPTIPIVLVYGVAAFATALRRVPTLWQRPVAAGTLAAFGLFLLLGASAYGQDVALIECEMGQTANWVAEHSESHELIAAHDIGRLGYVAQRPILDFAGLISPETIPIIRDEAALLDLAEARGARYLVTFADWYPKMVEDSRLSAVYATSCAGTRAVGGKPMTVYELEAP